MINQILEILNRAVAKDPEAMKALLLLRVPCNKELAEDKNIQVRTEGDGSFSVSPLGLLCGLAGTYKNGYSKIAATFATVCPTHGKVDKKVEEKCPSCESLVVLGALEGFVKTRK